MISGFGTVTDKWVDKSSVSTKQSETTKKSSSQQEKTDTIEIGQSDQYSVTYTKTAGKKTAAADIEALKAQAERATENLRTLVEKLLLQQSQKSGANGTEKTDLSGQDVTAQAQLSISDEGDYGVEAVSDRIVDFAVSICGNDTTKLEELKSAIDKGFAEAEKKFGGELPDICMKTYDAIMKKLDDWAGVCTDGEDLT
ncbi:hypothetical protein SDC9_115798 [bioreactor metagenome]|uniref:DUF5610 domain-containing protein n=1 Tax=bioreactor metagenome TaxID=1076179 RepID=A0A645C0K9_9ZZZZ